MNQLLIYTEQTSNRLTYTFDLLFKDLLGLNYELTSDKDFFQNHNGAKFSYARQPIKDELFFASVYLLFEKTIDLQPLGIYDYKELQGFFSTPKTSLLPFDIFASAFFMVSRYEEHFFTKKDRYDRYRGSHSLNAQGDFLEKPMVNYYAIELKNILSEKFPYLIFKKHKFEYLATFDVDMAYSYIDKGFKRTLGGFGRSFILSDYKAIEERFLVLRGKRKDPFDTFDYIFDVCNQYSVLPLFFFLLADQSQLDKNIPHTSKRFRSLIKSISTKSETGTHLSFASHDSSGASVEEIQRLEEITEKKIFRNRFHYLRCHLPESYERLIKYNITEDYSMGYAPRPGFRAGLCTPFYYFNLETNQQINLKVFPLAFMDATFTQYKRFSPDQSLQKIRQMMKYVEETGGLFMGIWHNSSFTEEGDWKGWRKVFETVTREATDIMKRQ